MTDVGGSIEAEAPKPRSPLRRRGAIVTAITVFLVFVLVVTTVAITFANAGREHEPYVLYKTGGSLKVANVLTGSTYTLADADPDQTAPSWYYRLDSSGTVLSYAEGNNTEDYTLMQVNYVDLFAGNAQPVVVAEHVSGLFDVDADHDLYYKDQKDVLHLYKNGKVTELGRSVDSFMLSSDEKAIGIRTKEGRIITVDLEDEEPVETVFPDNAPKLLWVGPRGSVVYTRKGSTISMQDKSNSRVIADGFDSVEHVTKDGKFYFSIQGKSTVRLIDVVNDRYKEEDAALRPPEGTSGQDEGTGRPGQQSPRIPRNEIGSDLTGTSPSTRSEASHETDGLVLPDQAISSTTASDTEEETTEENGDAEQTSEDEPNADDSTAAENSGLVRPGPVSSRNAQLSAPTGIRLRGGSPLPGSPFSSDATSPTTSAAIRPSTTPSQSPVQAVPASPRVPIGPESPASPGQQVTPGQTTVQNVYGPTAPGRPGRPGRPGSSVPGQTASGSTVLGPTALPTTPTTRPKTPEEQKQEYEAKRDQMDRYIQKLERDQLRKQLTDQTVTTTSSFLWYFDGSTARQIDSGMGSLVAASSDWTTIIYDVNGLSTNKLIDLSEITDIEKFKEQWQMNTQRGYKLAKNGVASTLAAAGFIGNINFAPDGDRITYIFGDQGSLTNTYLESNVVFDTVVMDKHVDDCDYTARSGRLLYYKQGEDGGQDLYENSKLLYPRVLAAKAGANDVLLEVDKDAANGTTRLVRLAPHREPITVADAALDFRITSGDACVLIKREIDGKQVLVYNQKGNKLVDIDRADGKISLLKPLREDRGIGVLIDQLPVEWSQTNETTS